MQIALLAPALAILWLLLSGHFDPLLLTFGLVSVAFVCWMAERMKIVDGESHPFGLIPRLSVFWLWLFKEIVKSNFDTASRILGPKSAVEPVVFNVPASQQTDLGIVIHANSITLTPGTVSLELGDGTIKVHALHADVAKSLIESGMNARVPD